MIQTSHQNRGLWVVCIMIFVRAFCCSNIDWNRGHPGRYWGIIEDLCFAAFW